MAPAIPTHDYYITLKVHYSATQEEIKTSYRRLARLHHPDKNGGSKSATVKTQQLNEAWDVLGDSCKRAVYNSTYCTKPSTSTPNAPKPTPTPQPSWQPPRPSYTAQDDAKEEAESQRKRKEWLDFEKYQEQKIRQCNKVVKALEAEIAALNAKIEENRTKLANDVPYWFNVFASMSKRMSEEEKNELRRQNLDSEAAIRIKQMPLDKERSLLKRLKDELGRRGTLESERLTAERNEKERRQRLAREAAAAEARRRAAEERAAREARENAARAEAAKAEAERNAAWMKKMTEQRKAREAANQRAQQEAAKKMEEQRKAREAADKKLREDAAKRERAAQGEREKEKKREKDQREREKRCTHTAWWAQIPGPLTCKHCTRELYRFGYQCPSCKTVACASCRGTLKAGRKPAKLDNSYTASQNVRTPRTHGTKGRSHYQPSYYPSPPSPPSYSNDYDYYDWD